MLENFSREQVKYLYEQHTQETGQEFTDEATEYTFYLTQGQPWLVNALAYQACFRDITDRTQPITKARHNPVLALRATSTGLFSPLAIPTKLRVRLIVAVNSVRIAIDV